MSQDHLGADAVSNATATGTSMGVGSASDSSQPRVPTGPTDRDAKAYVSSTGGAAEESSMAPTGDGLTSYGNTDTHAEAGAAGTDITASSSYGGKKAPDEQPGQVLEGGLHRPDYLSKGEQIPDRMGIAPRSDAEANVREGSRQQEAGLHGSYDADDVDAVQARLEKAHQ